MLDFCFNDLQVQPKVLAELMFFDLATRPGCLMTDDDSRCRLGLLVTSARCTLRLWNRSSFL